MLARVFPILLAAWLLAGLRLDAHVHWHDIDGAEMHSHVVTGFDADHALAHAQGFVDEGSDQIAPRVPIPLALLACVAGFALLWHVGAARPSFPSVRARATGPPPHIRPPSQAPPLRVPFA